MGRLSDRFGPGPADHIGSGIVALSFAGMATGGAAHSIWFAMVPLTTLLGIGMSFVVSPLSTAVMTSLADSETGIASGVNNAVARVAGLLAVAIGGGLAGVVFERALGGAAELPIFFGLAPETALDCGDRSDAGGGFGCGVLGRGVADGGAVCGVGRDRLVHAAARAGEVAA